MVRRIEVRLEDEVDLGLSMLPSFTSSLFIYDEVKKQWVKYLGFGKGCRIYVTRSKAICLGDLCSEEAINEWVGLWFNPYKYLKVLPSSIRYRVEALLECIPGLRIITSSFDKELIAIAVFLSRRTDYHVNVIKWLQELGLMGLEKKNIVALSIKYRSYQLRQLSEVIDRLINTCRVVSNDPWYLRRLLLGIKYVGPKICDAYLLFTKHGTYFTPADVHYRNFLNATSLLGIEPKSLLVPNKDLCLRYGPNCFSCKVRSKCVSGLSIALLKELSGYVQTLAYVIDKFLSRRALKYLRIYVSEPKINEIIRCLIRNEVIRVK